MPHLCSVNAVWFVQIHVYGDYYFITPCLLAFLCDSSLTQASLALTTSAATYPDASGPVLKSFSLWGEEKGISIQHWRCGKCEKQQSWGFLTPPIHLPMLYSLPPPPPPAEIFREVWDYFHKENLNPLTSCPMMRSLVSEGVSVKCLPLNNSPVKAREERGLV